MAIDVVAAEHGRRRHDRPDRPRPGALLRSSRARPRTGSSGWPRPRRCPSTSSTCPRREALEGGPDGPRPRARRPSPRRARSTCSSRSTTWATGSRAPSSCAPRRCARRTTADELWNGLVKDDLQVVATDHCPFDFHGQKELGRGDFRKIPNGLPGVEDRVDLLHDGGVVDGQDHEGALGRDHLDGAGQAVRDVPAQGRRSRSASDADLVDLRPEPEARRSRRRRITWTSTTRATRAGRSRAAATSS